MDIYVGRGGNQAIDLRQKSAAPLNCELHEEDGEYKVTLLNVAPVYADGERVCRTGWYTADTQLRIGNVTATVAEFAKAVDVDSWTDWGSSFSRLADYNAAYAFNSVTAAGYYDSEQEHGGPLFVLLWGFSACCMAYFLIEEGRMRKAQELIYEAGDDLYGMQNGDVRYRTAYAGVMALLAWFYVKIDRKEMAAIAMKGVRQLIGSGVELSDTVKDIINRTENSL